MKAKFRFKKFKIVNRNVQKYIHEAFLVVFYDSSTILYAIMNKKPIINLKSNLFDLNATSIKAYIKLKEYTNYISIYTNNDPLSNISIYVNDTDFKLFKTSFSLLKIANEKKPLELFNLSLTKEYKQKIQQRKDQIQILKMHQILAPLFLY